MSVVVSSVWTALQAGYPGAGRPLVSRTSGASGVIRILCTSTDSRPELRKIYPENRNEKRRPKKDPSSRNSLTPENITIESPPMSADMSRRMRTSTYNTTDEPEGTGRPERPERRQSADLPDARESVLAGCTTTAASNKCQDTHSVHIHCQRHGQTRDGRYFCAATSPPVINV